MKKETQTFCWQQIVLIPLAVFFLSGCAVVAGDMMVKGRDEIAASAAAEKLKKEYYWVNFNQTIPETYLFEKPRQQVWKEIIQVLEDRQEKIYTKDQTKGLILTEAKELPLAYEDKTSLMGVKKAKYGMEIRVEEDGKNQTYVTNYVTIHKYDKNNLPIGKIALPASANIIRGVFFGSLAANLYPEKKREALLIAKAHGLTDQIELETMPEKSSIVHVVESGDTLGSIAAKYTGNTMNYKKIAEHNNISDPKKIALGQEIIIPPDLLE
jgi:nucleoid-associated protein YgaU